MTDKIAFDQVHFEWAATTSTKDMPPRDFEDYQEAAKIILSLLAHTKRLEAVIDGHCSGACELNYEMTHMNTHEDQNSDR